MSESRLRLVFTITGLIDGKSYSEDVLVPDGREFAHIHHVYPDKMTERSASFAIYKEGDDTPLEQITCHFDAEQGIKLDNDAPKPLVTISENCPMRPTI